MMEWRSILTVVVVMALVPSPVRAQGLAAVAAKEKQRRKQPTSTPTKVYSEADLAGSGSKPTETVDQAGEDAAATRTSPGLSPTRVPKPAAKDTGGGGEASWRRRAAEARSRIKWAESNVQSQLVKRNAAAAADRMSSNSNCNIPDSVVREGRNAMKAWSCVTGLKTRDAQDAVDLAEQELKSARDAWVALEEEARRSGALPGWLR